MSLSAYQKKRRFNETPEPEGKEKSSLSGLRFVVQKHDASHVHYDFRLEMEGVLKSWAVPKGPSLNPADKRLAMLVEDHPYDYRLFEGVIPAGNYGGGTVIVWDEGTYELAGAGSMSQKDQERELLRQWHAGNIKFILKGKKLKGEFALFQMKGRGERAWILMKKKDEHASSKDVTKDERSAKSGKTLKEVATEHGTTVNHPGGAEKARKEPPIQLLNTAPKKAAAKKEVKKEESKKPAIRRNTGKASGTAKKAAGGKKKALEALGLPTEYEQLVREAPIPHDLIPMLATLTDKPFDNNLWLFEIKWDGYRAVAYVQGDAVELESRNLAPFTEKYAPVTEALRTLGVHAVLDGEIVAVNDKGLAVFQYLQNWQNTPVHLQYFIFDLLWLDGRDLTQLPLLERKRLLREVLPADHEVVKYSDHVLGAGKNFFDAAIAQDLEGVMAKKASSIYTAGGRTADWLKVKVNQRQEVVIAGYTEPRKSRKFFGSLLLGLYEGDRLLYIGHTGSGFTAKSLEQIYRKLQPLITGNCPFEQCPKGNTPVTWVRPRLVCEIKFTEWTKDRIARHPIFLGLRTDKKAKEAVFEKKISMKKLTAAPKKAAKKTAVKGAKAPEKKTTRAASKKGSSKKSGSAPIDLTAGKDQELKLDGHPLQLTNLDKLYWKKEKFSKGDMINYYLQVAPFILPYLLDRPQSLNRYPNGIDAQSFYQKDMKGKLPSWMKTHTDFSESTGQDVEYLVCSNEATLIYMANLGCIELHPWHSRVKSWQRPDWCLIDLDPDKTNTFDQVMAVALKVKEVLDHIGAEACCKTSGSTGIHIYIPLGARYDYDQSKQLAELIVTLVNSELPDLTSTERSPAKRKGLIYLDYLQNRETQTAAAPYSLRPKPGMPVSTPLDWSELKKGLKPTNYHARNIFERLRTEGDLFRPVLQKGIDLKKVLAKLSAQI